MVADVVVHTDEHLRNLPSPGDSLPPLHTGLVRGLPAAALYCSPEGAALRASLIATHGLEAVRDAVLALPAPHRFHPGTPCPVPVVAVTGIDGAGKSTHVTALCERLAADGYRVGTFKLYRQGAFLALADELSARVGRGAPLSNFRLSRVVKLVDSMTVALDVFEHVPDVDVIVADRYVETHLAAAMSQLGWDLAGHPALVALPPARRTVWLTLPESIALSRLAERQGRLTADEHPAGLRGYARQFAKLVAKHDLVADATAPMQHNLDLVYQGVREVLPAPSGRGGTTWLVPPHDGGVIDGGPTSLRVGSPGLEDRMLRLRARYVGYTGVDLCETFWAEASAADAVLQLRQCRPKTAKIERFPGVKPGSSASLVELGRLLAESIRP